MCFERINSAISIFSRGWDTVKLPMSCFILAAETATMTGLQWSTKITVRKIDQVCCELLLPSCGNYNKTMDVLFNTHNITKVLCDDLIPAQIKINIAGTCTCGTISALFCAAGIGVIAWKAYKGYGYEEIPESSPPNQDPRSLGLEVTIPASPDRL
jgi:hypothetical protein